MMSVNKYSDNFKKYYFEVVSSKVNNRIKNLKKKGYNKLLYKKVEELSVSETNEISNITIEIIKYIKNNIEIILIGSIEDVLSINKFANEELLKEIRVNPKYEEIVALILSKIFDYEYIIKEEVSYRLAKEQNSFICPYCNINYTYMVSTKQNKVITRAQFDHFYSKSKYPFLSLNIYNLVPSCPICNKIKGNNEFNINDYLYPYNENLELEKIFKLDINSYGNYEVILNDYPKFNNNKIDLYLDERYKKHNNYVNKLIDYSNMYTSEILKSLAINFEITETDTIRKVLGYISNPEEVKNESLGKLKNDIIDEIIDKRNEDV